MRAVVVSVSYSDVLSVSLPRARPHFSEVVIVTSQADADDVTAIARANDAFVHVTDAFYAGGAHFAKARAIEEALDVIGRTGRLCFLDADVILPARAGESFAAMEMGKLYGAHRRMAPWPLDPIPDEAGWGRYPRHPNVAEVPGYLQCFFAADRCLGAPPWHDVGFSHAGSADSFFQARWHPALRVRFPWDVLHLGEPAANWCGRATPLADGTVPPEAHERREKMRAIFRGRRGKSGDDRFRHEKLPPG
jgi:hypothetical protein